MPLPCLEQSTYPYSAETNAFQEEYVISQVSLVYPITSTYPFNSGA